MSAYTMNPTTGAVELHGAPVRRTVPAYKTGSFHVEVQRRALAEEQHRKATEKRRKRDPLAAALVDRLRQPAPGGLAWLPKKARRPADEEDSTPLHWLPRR
jgi:hypothetical protein